MYCKIEIFGLYYEKRELPVRKGKRCIFRQNLLCLLGYIPCLRAAGTGKLKKGELSHAGIAEYMLPGVYP